MQDTMAIAFLFGVIPIATFCMILGLRYLENKENMAMIERGLNPKEKTRKINPSQTLKNGLMFIGAGVGLLLAIIFTTTFDMQGDEGTGIYFSLIAIFGGLGMLAAYLYERKNPPGEEEL